MKYSRNAMLEMTPEKPKCFRAQGFRSTVQEFEPLTREARMKASNVTKETREVIAAPTTGDSILASPIFLKLVDRAKSIAAATG